MSGVVAGLMPTLPANSAITTRPACAALHPKPSWNNSGSRNGTATITIRYTEPPAAVARKLATRKMRRSSSGVGARSRWTTAPVSTTAATTRPVASTGTSTAPAPTLSTATINAATPTVVRTKPRRSSGGTAPEARGSETAPSARRFGTRRRASSSPATPSGTLITKIQRHDAYWLSTPPTAGASTGASSAGQVR
jgi:hypothetical protein